MKPKFEDVEREIRRLAHEHPDRKTHPQYTKSSGEPCCIFGHALNNLGVPIATLIEFDRQNEDGFGELPEVAAGDTLSPDSRREDRMWANEVQLSQDLGATWGEAVDKADRRFGRG
ncbi:hypothetical protein [Tsukamurella paurometabola]|uniref:Uncharacterized protein n=1 Tax=Tsukamurella paurometabola TaxID=2061 RepID=A0ABS5NDT1_TSUPA|nr:hypothetical protein [Tsukamurella paurometabola]MBS4102461.1 hypothetical protein [Tsukamurella paurometabola]